MTSPARRLGEWVSGLQRDDVPQQLVEKMRDHLLDTLGAGVVGDGRLPSRTVAEVYTTPGDVPLLIRGGSRDPRCAARINAVAVHSAEIDDTEGCDHSGAVVVPAILSAGRYGPAHGDDVLTAMVAGYEVGRRMQQALGGYDAHNSSGWHSTATCGVFAAAAATSRMMGLTAAQTTSALAIAASSSAGTWAFASDGTMTKQLHVANAAGAGYESAVLAREGATGPVAIFDDVWGGFFKTHGSSRSNPDMLTDALGTRWEAGHSAVKMYAACRSAHPAIDTVVDLLDSRKVEPHSVTGVNIGVSPFLRPMICPEQPRTVEAARMSLPVSIALLLLGATLEPDAYQDFADPRVTRLTDLITVVDAEDLPSPQTVRVTVQTSDGEYCVSSDSARGSETDPFTREEVRAKFRRLVTPRIGEDGVRDVIGFVDALGDGPVDPLPPLWRDA